MLKGLNKNSMAALAITGATILGGGAAINHYNNKKAAEEASNIRYEQRLDSAMVANDMDVNSLPARIAMGAELASNDYREIHYLASCLLYGLDPKLERTKDDIAKIDQLKNKIDSITDINIAESNSKNVKE